MPTRELKEGDHKVTIMKAELGQSYTGSERIELTLQAADGSKAIRHLYMTPRAEPYTFETLRSFGIDTDDPDYIDKIDALAGRGAKVRLMKQVGSTTPEVVSIWPLDEDRPKPSQDELRARIKKKHAKPAEEPGDGFDEKEVLPKASKPYTPKPALPTTGYPPPPLEQDVLDMTKEFENLQ